MASLGLLGILGTKSTVPLFQGKAYEVYEVQSIIWAQIFCIDSAEALLHCKFHKWLLELYVAGQRSWLASRNATKGNGNERLDNFLPTEMKQWGQWWEEICRADFPEGPKAVVWTVWSPRATKGLKLPSLGLQGEKVWAEGQRDGILQGHLGPGGKILFYALCPTNKLLGEPKPERSIWVYVQGRDTLWADTVTLSVYLCDFFTSKKLWSLCNDVFLLRQQTRAQN